MSTSDWTDLENDTLVAGYFAMFDDHVLRRSFVKAERHRALAQVLERRSAKSIEYKLQNVSGALQALGHSWLKGYAPATNFQLSLADAVVRWMDRHEDWTEKRAVPSDTQLQDAPGVYVGPPPTLANRPPPQDMEKMLRVARKFDVAGRDARNRALGRAGEELVFAHERATLRSYGRDDLARKVCWASEEKGDCLGYDIESFGPDGRPRLIEVKTTNGWERTPFHITRNELEVAEERRSEWCLFRLYEFSTEPKAFELFPPLEAHVTLMATTYQASFG
ncbi:DUF3883 domain-containing protein [Fuscovulum ytuae]|uniref:DUF3883 domain-containing protein n=1 Tax=Fuscovulum ytuae TaxID=3042299 RepID=A0ABY8Q7E2_9RHOB|nr:DUF3883 domain-containing protein [Fuscovulum sp. YMD61]WGV16011.1 DUF3883 domain-containing protein [Fuscovulum sp. YMD61]